MTVVDSERADGPDEERWAQAESVLAGAPTAAGLARQATQRVFTWLLVVSLLGVAGGCGVLLVVLVPAGLDGHADQLPGWHGLAGFVIVVVGVALEVVGLVALVRGGQWGQRWRAPTAVLTRGQRRALLRQVLGKQVADPRRLPLARDLAARLVRSTRTSVVFAGLAIVLIGEVVMDPAPVEAGCDALALVSFATWGALVWSYARRSRRFLVAHPVTPVE